MKDYFIVVPSMAIEKGLKGYELLIYCLINSYNSQDHACYFKYKKLGELVGCSEKQAKRCINSLIGKQIIFVTVNGWFTDVGLAKTNIWDVMDKMSDEQDKMSEITDNLSWDALLDDLDKY